MSLYEEYDGTNYIMLFNHPKITPELARVFEYIEKDPRGRKVTVYAEDYGRIPETIIVETDTLTSDDLDVFQEAYYHPVKVLNLYGTFEVTFECTNYCCIKYCGEKE